MAKFNLDNYLDKDGLGFPLNFRRGNPNPLDNSSVWKSLSAAQNYAQTDPTAYVGQILSVVNYTAAVTDEEGTVTTPSQSTVEVYYIKDEAGALEPVGTSPVGDEGTITVAEDGTVSLYGIAGLELTRTDDEGNTTNITYQPLYVNGKLTWVEPSATTVEGLAAEIEGLKTRISALEVAVGDDESGLVKGVADNAAAIAAETEAREAADKTNADAIAAVDAKIGTVTEGKTVAEMIADAQTAATYDDTKVKEDIQKNADDIAELQSTHATDKETLETAIETAESNANTYTDNKIAEVMNNSSEAIDSVMELATVMQNNKSAIEALEEIANGHASQDDLDAAVERVATLETNMETKASADDLAGLTTRVTEAETAIGTKASADDLAALTETVGGHTEELAALTDTVGKKADASTVAELAELVGTKADTTTVDELATLVGTKADASTVTTLSGDLDAAEVAIAALQEAMGTKVDKVEGSRLITSDEAAKLEKLTLEGDQVVVSGTISADNVTELGSWITKNRDSVAGLLKAEHEVLLSSGIEAGAQVNDIEKIILGNNDTALVIADKTVTIPVATAEVFGVVKASTAENQIKVYAADVTDEGGNVVTKAGTMEVNSLNVSKLVQTAGDVLIINGGAANM